MLRLSYIHQKLNSSGFKQCRQCHLVERSLRIKKVVYCFFSFEFISSLILFFATVFRAFIPLVLTEKGLL